MMALPASSAARSNVLSMILPFVREFALRLLRLI
jgi:hypothetical protein